MLNRFCVHYRLPRAKRQRLREYLLEARADQTAADCAEVLNILSPHLVRDILLEHVSPFWEDSEV